MKFEIEKKQLNDILKLSSSVINEQAVNPILTCILVQTDLANNQIFFTFANETVAFKHAITNVNIDEDFSFCVKAKIFNGMLSKVNATTISFEKIDSTLRIMAGTFESRINLTDMMLYPEFNFSEYSLFKKIMELTPAVLSRIYNVIAPTIVSLGESGNIVLSGMHFQTKDNDIAIVSTDSFRASYLLIPNDTKEQFDFIIEPQSLKYIMDNAAKASKIEVYLMGQKMFFKWDNTISLVKLSIAGGYPNIYNHFTKQLSAHFSIKNRNLLNMLETGASLVQGDKVPTANVSVDKDKVEINYKSLDFGSSYESTNWESFNGVDIAFQVNIKLLISILKIYDMDDVLDIWFSNREPIVIFKKDSTDLKHLILPLRGN